MPDVSLGSGKVGVTSVDLSSVIEPIQGYLLSGDSEGNFFTGPRSIFSCMELLETFSYRAFQCDYNTWESVNAHGYEKIRPELEKSYNAVRIASDVESSSSLSEPVFVSERLPEQRRRPAQRPRIDIGKTYHSGVAELLAGKLRSKRKTSDAESSWVFRYSCLIMLRYLIFCCFIVVIDDLYMPPQKKVDWCVRKMKNVKAKNEYDAQKGAELSFAHISICIFLSS